MELGRADHRGADGVRIHDHFRPKRPQHSLAVVARQGRFTDGGLSFGHQPCQQNAGFDLG